MQYFVLFLFALSIGIASSEFALEDLERFMAAAKSCRASTNVDLQLLSDAKKGIPINDPVFDCYMDCLVREIHLITPDGNWDVDSAEKMVPESFPHRAEIFAAARECGVLTNGDACGNAHVRYKCMLDKNFAPVFL